MKLPTTSAWPLAATVLCLAALAAPRADDPAPVVEPAARVAPAILVAPPAPERSPRPSAEPAAAIGDARFDPALGRYVAKLGDGRAVLTLEPRLQARLERTLESYAVPWGATVLLEPATGRILAMAEHSSAEPGRRGLATSALAPAASVFKLVTAAALLEQGVRPDDEVCFHGGKRRLQPRLLADDPRRDRSCFSLERAFGRSVNVVFAKLAGRDLEAAQLRSTAERFLFNTEIPFARPVERSRASIPDDDFGLANTAAGFGDVRLSALHGALLAAIVANGGVLVPPALVEQADGATAPVPAPPSRVVDEAVAAQLAGMMRATVTEGTARRTFGRGPRALRGISVAGKTGSLMEPQPFRDYTWFVGYAPVDRPEVVVATVIVNGRLWRVRAPTVAKDALEAFFTSRVVARDSPPGLRTAKAPAP